MSVPVVPSSKRPSTKVWESLRPLLPSRGSDCDYWWDLTGLHLAYLIDAAGYSIERQYEALLFHYHRVVGHTLSSASHSSVAKYGQGFVPGTSTCQRWHVPLADRQHDPGSTGRILVEVEYGHKSSGNSLYLRGRGRLERLA